MMSPEFLVGVALAILAPLLDHYIRSFRTFRNIMYALAVILIALAVWKSCNDEPPEMKVNNTESPKISIEPINEFTELAGPNIGCCRSWFVFKVTNNSDNITLWRVRFLVYVAETQSLSGMQVIGSYFTEVEKPNCFAEKIAPGEANTMYYRRGVALDSTLQFADIGIRLSYSLSPISDKRFFFDRRFIAKRTNTNVILWTPMALPDGYFRTMRTSAEGRRFGIPQE